MTLVVSLRVPDGVVIAADSLQTTTGTISPGLKDFKVKDDKGQEVNIKDLKLPPIQIPTSTLPYAQKLFPFNSKYGIATFGSAIINKRTIYNHIKNIEHKIEDRSLKINEVVELIQEHFAKQLDQELKEKKQSLPKGAFAFGFQIVGYESIDDISGKTIEVTIGNPGGMKVYDGIGCTISGDNIVVKKLWELGKQRRMVTNYGAFSLQDAIDYVEFLINTTASFQRFANMIPTVGGSVDVALITSYGGFKWIKSKPLTKIIEK